METWQTPSPCQEEYCAHSKSQTSAPISWSCKKQTAVSHSSTEAKIISLDAGLRTERTSALSLWETVTNVSEPPVRGDSNGQTKQTQQGKDMINAKGNIQAHKILTISDAVQCSSCHNNSRPRHTYCPCGKMLPGASDEVAQQSAKKVVSCFKILTTGTCVFKTGPSRG